MKNEIYTIESHMIKPINCQKWYTMKIQATKDHQGKGSERLYGAEAL